MRLIVGLGNPGAQYRNHRHNAGFMVLDRVHFAFNGSEWREKHQGLMAQAVVGGKAVTLLKPQTFMNLSGRSVLRAVQGSGIKAPEVLVLHDELELPFGELRARMGGGLGGHNGLRDINAAIGPDFGRVRVGIGRPTQGTVEHYVLSGFMPDELARLDAVLDRGAELVARVVAEGVPPPPPQGKPRKA